MNGRLVLYWTSAPVAALPRCAHSRRVSYRIADLIVECGPAGAFGGNAPAWPAPQNGGRGSVQPGDRASDRHCERDADRNSPESARESWQRMSASASRFEHVERVRVDGPRGHRVAAEFASAGASTHFGCFVERAPTPPGGGDPRVRGALRDVGQIVSGGTGSGSVGGVGSGAGSGSGPGIGGVGEGGSGVSFGMGRVCPPRLSGKRNQRLRRLHKTVPDSADGLGQEDAAKFGQRGGVRPVLERPHASSRARRSPAQESERHARTRSRGDQREQDRRRGGRARGRQGRGWEGRRGTSRAWCAPFVADCDGERRRKLRDYIGGSVTDRLLDARKVAEHRVATGARTRAQGNASREGLRVERCSGRACTCSSRRCRRELQALRDWSSTLVEHPDPDKSQGEDYDREEDGTASAHVRQTPQECTDDDRQCSGEDHRRESCNVPVTTGHHMPSLGVVPRTVGRSSDGLALFASCSFEGRLGVGRNPGAA